MAMNELAAIIRGLQDPSQNAPTQNNPIQMQQPDMQSIASAAPRLTQKRSLGNVLSDFFSGDRLAQNMRNPGKAALSDLLGNFAHIGRGEDPSYSHMQLAQELQDRDRQEQARNAFAQIFQSANPQLQQLAQYDPQTAFKIQQAEQARQDAMQKPQVFGNTIIPRTPEGGYDIEGAKSFGNDWSPTTMGEQPGIVNKRTGEFNPTGAPKPKLPVFQKDANGVIHRIDPVSGKDLGTYGAPKAPPTKGNPQAQSDAASGVTSKLGDLQKSIDSLRDQGALVKPGGNPLDNALNYAAQTGIGQAAAGAVGTKSQNERDNITRLANSVLLDMKQALGLSAKMLDTNQDVQRALGVINNPHASYENMTKAVQSLKSQFDKISKASAALALPKVGEVKNGYRFKGGNPAYPASWEKAQ